MDLEEFEKRLKRVPYEEDLALMEWQSIIEDAIKDLIKGQSPPKEGIVPSGR